MGRPDGAGEDLDEPGGRVGLLGAVAGPLLEGAAGDVFERQKRAAVDLADLEELDDVRVLEPGDRFRLGPEPGAVGVPGYSPDRIILMATDRFSARWTAFYTTPIPPRPSSDTISYPGNSGGGPAVPVAFGSDRSGGANAFTCFRNVSTDPRSAADSPVGTDTTAVALDNRSRAA